MRLPSSLHPLLRALAAHSLFAIALLPLTQAQESPQKPSEKTAAKDSAPTESKNPAQIELLETKIRFEANGDSRKEVHTRVRINSELGVRQFARLNFDYNRSFQSIEIPLVRITHPSGGTADILPSAITDNPNPAVVTAPAYQDVRVKSVRILGLAPDDTLEYRIITTTTHHPLAPDFWLDHSFDRTGVVTEEHFEIDVPGFLFEDPKPSTTSPTTEGASVIHPPSAPTSSGESRHAGRISISSETPETATEHVSEGEITRLIYRWSLSSAKLAKSSPVSISSESPEPDVILTTFSWWPRLALKVKLLLYPSGRPSLGSAMADKYREILSSRQKGESSDEAIYRFVSEEIKTVDLPPGSTGFHARLPLDVLSSGYGTTEEKAGLFLALLPAKLPPCHFALSLRGSSPANQLPRPSLFTHILVVLDEPKQSLYLDPASEVTPFGVIPADLRGKTVLMLNNPGFGFMSADDPNLWRQLPADLPFAATQRVKIDATLTTDGTLTAKVHYSLRGDNELLLRVAFHKAPKEKWKELAQLLSLSDGFRGKVTSVTASDPSATREPFILDYEITMPKFVDWSKKPVRIPALLPQLGLPDPPAKPAAGAAVSPIDLGTPLEVETHMTLHLPPGTTAQTPTGTSVQRDYATYASQYSARGPVITGSRHINFLLREVPAERAADYNAFLRAVQSDEAQDFTLDRPEGASGKPAPPAEKPATTKPHP